MSRAADIEYMQRALSLAEKGRGKTSPNPMVGAVIVKGGAVVGEGYHHAAGEDHAEIVAIKDTGRYTRGATLYVTLEPCCHTGRTGPCTAAVIEAGISKVVFAVHDPDPRVKGKGARQLRKAGIEVVSGLLKKQARLLNDQHFGYHENGRPYVILKMAQTLDGRIASRTGDSRWISSADSLKLAHRMRSEVDAVVVGMGTVRRDDPALTVRLVKGPNPYRVVISSSLKFPRKCQLLNNNDDYRTVIATTAAAAGKFSGIGRQRRLILWGLKAGRDGLVDLFDFMEKAGDFGIRSLLIEGGAALATSFLTAGLVDKYVVITAPLVVGDGIDAIGDMDIRRMADSMTFDHYTFERSGADSLFIGYPRKRK